jgi:DNA-binding MarR family transcriptional regulator
VITPTLDRVYVGRHLLGRVTGALVAAYDRELAPIGLTLYQGSMLLSCVRREANTPVELAHLVGLDVSTITRMVDRLEEKGLVRRTRSKDDRRQVFLRLTRKGHGALRRASPVARRLALRAWKGVTEREKQSLRNLVHKVLTNLARIQDQ